MHTSVKLIVYPADIRKAPTETRWQVHKHVLENFSVEAGAAGAAPPLLGSAEDEPVLDVQRDDATIR